MDGDDGDDSERDSRDQTVGRGEMEESTSQLTLVLCLATSSIVIGRCLSFTAFLTFPFSFSFAFSGEEGGDSRAALDARGVSASAGWIPENK